MRKNIIVAAVAAIATFIATPVVNAQNVETNLSEVENAIVETCDAIKASQERWESPTALPIITMRKGSMWI
jgi:ABC-type methionine transport system permease subunit